MGHVLKPRFIEHRKPLPNPQPPRGTEPSARHRASDYANANNRAARRAARASKGR